MSFDKGVVSVKHTSHFDLNYDDILRKITFLRYLAGRHTPKRPNLKQGKKNKKMKKKMELKSTTQS